jgi:hypothetical protein
MSNTVSTFSRRLLRVALASALLGAPLSARAANLAGAVNVTPQVGGCPAVIVDLNGAVAGTNLPFTLPASALPRRVGVLFNGECSVAAADDFTYLDINVQLLNAAGVLIATLAPSSSDNAFCTSTGDSALEHWVSASTNAQYVAPAGAAVGLQVRVIATPTNCAAGEQWRLDDLSTIVTN